MVAGVIARFRTLRRARRRVVALVAVLSVAVTGGLIALALTHITPAWWGPAAADDAAVTALAAEVENAVVRQITAARPPASGDGPYASEPWSVSLQAKDANAWLAARLPRWLANQREGFAWPPNLSSVQVAL